MDFPPSLRLRVKRFHFTTATSLYEFSKKVKRFSREKRRKAVIFSIFSARVQRSFLPAKRQGGGAALRLRSRERALYFCHQTKVPKVGIGTHGSYVPPLPRSRAAFFCSSAHCGFRFGAAFVFHRCGNTICGFRQKTANRAAASKAARFICHRQRLRRFPLSRWHDGIPTPFLPKVHRCGNAFCGFRQKTAKCAAASKPPRFICPRQRLRRFPSAPRCGGGSARHSVGADSIRPRAAGCRPYGGAGQ